MPDKEPTQAMGDGGHKGDPGGTGVPTDERGGPIGPKKQDKPFRGGQSEAAYNGSGRLGEQRAGDGENPNAPAREDQRFLRPVAARRERAGLAKKPSR